MCFAPHRPDVGPDRWSFKYFRDVRWRNPDICTIKLEIFLLFIVQIILPLRCPNYQPDDGRENMSRSQPFDLNLLRLLIVLHRTRRVSKAAEQLDLSQPATSLALARLRKTVGDVLFVRTSAGMMPTSRCTELVASAEQAIGKIDATITRRSAFNSATARHEFVVTMPDVGELHFLPRRTLCRTQQRIVRDAAQEAGTAQTRSIAFSALSFRARDHSQDGSHRHGSSLCRRLLRAAGKPSNCRAPDQY